VGRHLLDDLPAGQLETTSRDMKESMFAVASFTKAASDVPYNMPSRKRKAEDEDMSSSPTSSPATAPREIARPVKRMRDGGHARSIPLSLLLDMSSHEELVSAILGLCEQHPQIGPLVAGRLGKPTAQQAGERLAKYKQEYMDAVPYGQCRPAFVESRTRRQYMALFDTMTDLIAHFSPPNEQQPSESLKFLDEATNLLHTLDTMNVSSYEQQKSDAYDTIARSWELVIREGMKRGVGLFLIADEWRHVLNTHNQKSGGRFQQAVSALGHLPW
jgi:protein Cut8